MFKKILTGLCLGIIILIPSSIAFGSVEKLVDDKPVIFYGQGCPHCIKVHQFLEKEKIEIKEYEIYQNGEDRDFFNQMCDQKNIPLLERGVPMLFTDTEYFVGYGPIINAIKNYFQKDKIENQNNNIAIENTDEKNLSIFLIIGAAVVDAVNPCAFAVLIILLTTILASNNRKRTLLTGLAFAFSIFISYFLMGLGLYKVIASAQFSSIFLKLVAVLAILLGLFNLKDFFWYGKGFLLEVPLSWRPKMKSIIRGVSSPMGAFLIGFIVSLFLLPCTSGPYIVILSLLSEQETFYQAVIYLVLYNAIFILPMLGITALVYLGLNPEKAEKLRTTKVKVLHLIAGLLMLGMGIYIWLTY